MAALVLGLIGLRLAVGEGRIDVIDVDRVHQPLVSAPARDGGDHRPPPPQVALLEDGPYGQLPRIGSDGRQPFITYARPFTFDDPRPKIAIMVLDLGLQAAPLAQAVALPAPMTLHFSPYAPDLPGLFERARWAGHEVVLGLPLESDDLMRVDPGPQALRADAAEAETLDRLAWVLGRARGYVAVASRGGRFAESARLPAVLDVLAHRGLALIEIGERRLALAAAAEGLPYASTATPVDLEPSVPAIDTALAALEAEARVNGSALGVVLGYPVALDRVRLWSATLEVKGLALAPASALIVEQSGLAVGLSADGRRDSTRS